MRLILLILCLTACARATAPFDQLPADAVRFTPGVYEALALDSVRACITAHGSVPNPTLGVTDLAWYTVPDSTLHATGESDFVGFAGPTWIVLAAPDLTNPTERWRLVQHEIAHELVHEAVPHSSPFWIPCGLMAASATTVFTIP